MSICIFCLECMGIKNLLRNFDDVRFLDIFVGLLCLFILDEMHLVIFFVNKQVVTLYCVDPIYNKWLQIWISKWMTNLTWPNTNITIILIKLFLGWPGSFAKISIIKILINNPSTLTYLPFFHLFLLLSIYF